MEICARRKGFFYNLNVRHERQGKAAFDCLLHGTVWPHVLDGGGVTPQTCAFLTNPEGQRPRVSASPRQWLENSELPPATTES